TLVFAVGNRGGLAREMGERIARHAAALAGERLGDPAALTARLAQLHAELDLDAAVRDLDGRLLASGGQALAPPSAADLAMARAGSIVTRPRPLPFALAPGRDPASCAVGAA